MNKRRQKKRKLKTLTIVISLLLLFALFFVYKIFGPNTGSFTQGAYLYIRTGADYTTVKNEMIGGSFIKDINSFNLLAKSLGYPKKVGAGKYHISPGMSNYQIIRMLRAHRQTPVKLVINKLRTKKDFIHLLSNNLEADSLKLEQLTSDSAYLSQFGLDSNTIMCAVIPDTYEFYWNTSADKAFRKIEKNYQHFWNTKRTDAAKQHELTPQQATTIASIVEEETNNAAEKPNIASVYLNRLKKGIKLQADPTARFAYGDFTIKRITNIQTSIASAYNTYYAAGLPPGPICTPSEQTIDAVIFSPQTTYLYFCAKGDGSGTHLFASTYEEHQKNAKAYHQLLNAQGVH